MLRHVAAALGLMLLATSLSACIVEEGGGGRRGGWCYWHPGACR